MHFTVICCTNKCIMNERYIPEHQNKLNIYDLQNYEFLQNFFQPKKKIVKWKKFVKFEFSIYAPRCMSKKVWFNKMSKNRHFAAANSWIVASCSWIAE